ncbi:hypothetical protein AAAC51_06425 [Priestia megaterium]
MEQQGTTIFMGKDQVTVTTVDELGMKSIKQTSIDNVQAVFMLEQAMETPLLPSQWGVVKYYRKNHYEGYVLTTAPSERIVNFDTRRDGVPESMTVPIPPLVWIFEVLTNNSGKKLMHSMVYVLKHELLSLKDDVLHCPYPNIGVSHGICWGRDLPSVPTGKSIQNIPARFFSQPFNTDLSTNRTEMVNLTLPNGSTRETDNALDHMIYCGNLLEKSKKEETPFVYPFETLKKAGTLNVEKAIKNYLPGVFNQ